MANEPKERTTVDCEGVQMTPVQSNEVLESRLTHLKPVLECAHGAMVQLKEDLANGKFDVRKLIARAKKRAGQA